MNLKKILILNFLLTITFLSAHPNCGKKNHSCNKKHHKTCSHHLEKAIKKDLYKCLRYGKSQSCKRLQHNHHSNYAIEGFVKIFNNKHDQKYNPKKIDGLVRKNMCTVAKKVKKDNESFRFFIFLENLFYR
ncbi:hypothetical protein KAH94_02385 [bacterium]|nr:hypothetical protein [bacterium]